MDFFDHRIFDSPLVSLFTFKSLLICLHGQLWSMYLINFLEIQNCLSILNPGSLGHNQNEIKCMNG